jgi:GntR family transcriptional regulator/MocR family aminotransferase
MPVEWAGLGPELLVTIDRDLGTGLRAQLEDQLRDAIRRGRLAGHEKLPSSPARWACRGGSSRSVTPSCRPRGT